MARRPALALTLCGLLAGAALVLSLRVERHFERGGRLAAELGRAHLVRLAPETLACLERLDAPVFVTYFASPESEVPSSMRAVERGVTGLLEALHAGAPERFDFQIVDPTTRPDLADFAARRRVAPFRLRSVTRDAWSEVTVWSSLSIAYGERPEMLLAGIGPETLPRLQSTLVRWLEEARAPRAARIGLAAPAAGFDELEDALSERGEVRRLDPVRPQDLADLDLLVWMQPSLPRGAEDACLAALGRMLERGGSVLVAFQRLVLGAHSLVELPAEPPGDVGLAVGLDERALPLLEHFGLRAERGLLLDETSEPASFRDERRRAPFLVRCIAPNQDFHTFRGQPNGTLLFAAPTPLGLEDARLRALGWSSAVLATTSESAWIEEEPVAPRPALALAAMQRTPANAVAKQALAVALSGQDSWRGRAIFLGSTAPFEDGLLHREHVAHPRLLATLLDECLSDERRVVAGAAFERPEPLPPLDARARLAARALGVFAFPLALALAVLVSSGGLARARRAARVSALLGALRPLLPGGLALLVLATLVAGARALDLGLDLSADGRNRLAPQTRALARRAGELGPIEVELVASRPSALPPLQRAAVARAKDLLAALGRAGARLDLAEIVADELGPAERDVLAERGVEPHESAVQDGDTTSVRRFFAALLLRRGTREERIELVDETTIEALEYRLALALALLEGRKRPALAFASDVPRLSAAEAYEEYQQQGLFAPKGTDVYALAREVLRSAGVTVTHVDPRAPVIPADTDALVWLQPRRPIEPMIEAFVRYLVGGGKALLAVQHFNIESLQHRGSGFGLVYWPQPQSPDVEHLYFPELSIELVREVVFDELSTPITTETKLRGRRAGKDFELQTSALPFLVRASAANFDPRSSVTATLGDQACLWTSWLRFDPARLAALGLTARTLITTSEKSWTYAWKSGWLPEDVLAGPPPAPNGAPAFQPHLPLAVLFEGTFPAPAKALRMPFSEPAAPPSEPEAGADSGAPTPAEAAPASAEPAPAPWPTPAPGKLLFLACSELFKNPHVLDPDHRGADLLWNGTLSLALEPELAAIATRRARVPGFGYVEPGRRLFLRGVVLAAGPLALLGLGLGLALVRRAGARRGGRP